ncbi:DNA-directed RNA polymerases I and III subunit RPAC1 [Nematocida sp. AWRm77]|nr:DNA-directed RNA polymerases I and III subunit RPAC1 [Nematocida sp. AWRm77]
MDEYLKSIEVHKAKEEENELVLRVNGIDASLANAVRRTVISDTPTMAIEWVYIRENSSVMADEILSHRLGLVPIIANPEMFMFLDRPEGFVPENDTVPENSIYFDLVVSNPSEETVSVYSEQIRVTSQHKNVFAKPGILITRLGPRQKIECKMIGIKGVGREHSKWMPTSICGYRFVKHVDIKDQKQVSNIRKYFRSGLEHNGKDFFVNENMLQMNTDVLKDHPGAVEITVKENEFVFELETITDTPASILRRAFHVLQTNLSHLHKEAQEAVQQASMH